MTDALVKESMQIQMKEQYGIMTVKNVRQQIAQIQDLMKACMRKKEHFDTLPGYKKPFLLKAGAEKLSMMFRLAPVFEVIINDLQEGHKEYRVNCTISHIESGKVLGSGMGSCSTMESKYRYRETRDFKVIGDASAIPNDYRQKKQAYRQQGLGCKKVGDEFVWVQYSKGSGEKTENPDIADTYNTVLKMAKKRAHVDAILTVTAASDIFVQDDEEMAEKPSAEHIRDALLSIEECDQVVELLRDAGMTETMDQKQFVWDVTGKDTLKKLCQSDLALLRQAAQSRKDNPQHDPDDDIQM